MSTRGRGMESDYDVGKRFAMFLLFSIILIGGFVIVFPDVVVIEPVFAAVGVVVLAIVMTGVDYVEQE